ncbi:MAG: NOP5/NOP56 family protein [Thermoproteota archaeon]
MLSGSGLEESLSLVETAAGLMVLEGDRVEPYLFKSVEEAVKYYSGVTPQSVASFLRRWRGRSIMVERRSIVKTLLSMGLKPVVEEPLKKAVELRADAASVSETFGLSVDDYRRFAAGVAARLAQARIEELAKSRDLDIVIAMQAYDELVKMLNILQDRIMIWVKEREPSLLEEHKDAEKLVKNMASSNGPEPPYIKRMAELYLKTGESRNAVEDYIGMLMDEAAPNLSTVIGPLLGARLVSKTGSLSRLASLPASTIQILGAEKALFRALRKRGRPPKHGIIFQHPWVHGSPRKIRGKAARLLASRIAVAARVDCFSGRFIGEELKKDVENRLKSLKGGED